jgi:hypothetical protein
VRTGPNESWVDFDASSMATAMSARVVAVGRVVERGLEELANEGTKEKAQEYVKFGARC